MSSNVNGNKFNQNCCGNNKWKTKRLCVIFVIFQVLFSMWIFTVALLYFIKESNYEIPRKTKNISKEFNFHKPILQELYKYVEDYDYTLVLKNTTNKQFNSNGNNKADLQKHYIVEDPLLPRVNCRKIIRGDLNEIKSTSLTRRKLDSKRYEKTYKKIEKFNQELPSMTRNCTKFRLFRKYFDFPLTPEEQAYPIAYIITIHNRFDSFERLLRSIYHPQNIYCVHVDKKSPQELLKSVQNLSGCFENVFVASRLTDIHYSHWSRVEADLNCLRDLVKKSNIVRWKYVINLCGQDFPLKTNLEIVQALKSLCGFNNLESVQVPPHKTERYEFRYKLSVNKGIYATMEKTNIKKSPSPLDTPMFSGSAYYIWKREAVEFMLRDAMVQKFFTWNEDSYFPDEHMWASLQRWYPHIPGSLSPHPNYDSNELQSIVRLVKWGGLDTRVYPKCAGTFRRGVCVYGVGDLSWLLQQRHLFANKFDSNVDPYAIECLDLWLRNRTIFQTLTYRSLGFV